MMRTLGVTCSFFTALSLSGCWSSNYSIGGISLGDEIKDCDSKVVDGYCRLPVSSYLGMPIEDGVMDVTYELIDNNPDRKRVTSISITIVGNEVDEWIRRATDQYGKPDLDKPVTGTIWKDSGEQLKIGLAMLFPFPEPVVEYTYAEISSE